MAIAVYGPEEIGEIKIGNTILPVAFQSMVVTSNLRLKEVKSAGKSGSSKQPLGWEDATIELQGIAADDIDPNGLSVVDKIQALDDLFFAQDKKGKPLVYPITNIILAAKRIQYCIITSCKTDVPGASTICNCTLTLEQHIPTQAKKAAKRKAVAKWTAVAKVEDDGVGNGQSLIEGEDLDGFYGQTISIATEQETYTANVAKYGAVMPAVGRPDAAASLAPSLEF